MPASWFEAAGIVFGLVTCSIILLQVIKEYRNKSASSLSFSYIFGWLLIFLFWTFYGLRFNALAIILTNATAFFLQTIMIIVVLKKRNKKSES
jgi:uncharacterized protein with PQ loop repeat